ncbi:SDR family oxidoreductase [Planctomicrobium sp. SH664]|uniref:SDR family oxidoreductase n=1 Tax=Planctomicrobium sp. SH664 TaxID=3448125 RepID=UPI003F5B005D
MSPSASITNLFDLSARVFLVIGGARDLGRELASALAEAGADGVITSRNASPALDTAAQLSAATGRRIVGSALDATNEQQIRELVQSTVSDFGSIDILVNNVGGGGRLHDQEAVHFEHRQVSDWDRLQRLNLTAPWLVSREVTPVMRKQGRGSVIHIASIAGLIGRDRRVYPEGMMPQTLDYAAAKGGLIALNRDLAACLGRDGIRSNVISPGGIERNQPAPFIENYSEKTMLGRMARVSDFKGAVVFLASDASSYVTGHNLVIDGGFSVWQ